MVIVGIHLQIMNPIIPADVAKAIDRLRAEAQSKWKLADELERNYTGQEPSQMMIMSGGLRISMPESNTPLTIEKLIDTVKQKGGRATHLAKRLKVPESKIHELVAASNGRLFIPDWRGWVKLSKHK